jgi:hypothetical protein
MELPCAASGAACPNDPIKRHRLGHAFKFVAASLLGDEQAGHLALYPRGDHNRARFSQGLCPRRDVRDVTENLARRIDHHRPSVNGDPCGQCGLAHAFVLAVQIGERPLD